MCINNKYANRFLVTLRCHNFYKMPELNFLLWNIKGRGEKVKEVLTQLITKYNPDFLLLIETDIIDIDLERLTVGIQDYKLKSVMNDNEKAIRLYANTKYAIEYTHEYPETLEEDEIFSHELIATDGKRRQIKDRIVFFHLKLENINLLIVAVHFISKKGAEAETQYKVMRRWRG